MIRKLFYPGSLLLGLILFTGLARIGTPLVSSGAVAVNWDENTPVYEVLKHFGDAIPSTRPATRNEDEIRRGMELFTTGTTTGPDGKKAARQSKYFVCTHCHNNQKEDPDLRVSDPEKRLEFCLQNNLSFLQGTTMYGTVNKVSWYNGDYYKKYGDLVKPANSSLDEAIHLCATVCSQGRDFEEWEMNAIRAYYWSLEYKLGDLSLSQADWQKLRDAGNKSGPNPEMATWLKTFFLSGSPATFGEGPEDLRAGYKTTRPPDPAKGKAIYNLSCMKCHTPNGPSMYLSLDESKLSRDLIRRNITKPGDMSLYHLVRHGTPSEGGHEAYMPHYPLERMNDDQVEDLRAYIEGKGS